MITTNTALISTEQRRLFPRGGPYAPARVAPLARLMRIDLRRPTGTPLRGYMVPNEQAGSPQVMVGEHQLVQISTGEYKIKPLKAAARELLGYPHPTRVPPGVFAEQAIGISVDEVHRAKDADVRYLRNVFPLLDLKMSRDDCIGYLAERGFGETVKSDCVGCPYSGNARLRWLRDNDPDAWHDLITFDKAIRQGSPRATANGAPLRGEFYVHRSLRPLDKVDLRPRRQRHLAIVEDSEPDGCSPWSCRSGDSVDKVSPEGRAA